MLRAICFAFYISSFDISQFYFIFPFASVGAPEICGVLKYFSQAYERHKKARPQGLILFHVSCLFYRSFLVPLYQGLWLSRPLLLATMRVQIFMPSAGLSAMHNAIKTAPGLIWFRLSSPLVHSLFTAEILFPFFQPDFAWNTSGYW